MNILFICRYNRFRSRVAEALFSMYTKDKNFNVKSAGIMRDYSGEYLISEATSVLNTLKVAYNDKKADIVNNKLIEWADKIVVVADDVPKNLFPEEKTVQIDIPDEHYSDKETLNTVKNIDKYVKKLIKELT